MRSNVGSAAWTLLASAIRSFGRSWRTLAETDVLYKAIAFVVLIPLIGVLLRWFVGHTGSAAVADVDIALFFVTTKVGTLAFVVIAALGVAVLALEQACLMTLGLGDEAGVRLRVRDAFVHAGIRAHAILRLTAQLVVRVLLIAAPFLAAAGLAAWWLLREHDINYYLKDRPPAFWAAGTIVATLLLALAAILVRVIASWLLVIPIVVFERTLPFRAFGESARRMQGRRLPAALALAAWGAPVIAVPLLATGGLRALGRAVVPAASGTLAGLLLFASAWVIASVVVIVALEIVATALFSLIVVRLYIDSNTGAGDAFRSDLSEAAVRTRERLPIPWKGLVGGLAAAVVLVGGIFYVALADTWRGRTVLVFAHRGASADAPENTLAAFRLAREQGTDVVELDVQESSDGIVLVAHDRDLMKVARSPLAIWSSTAEQLRAIDVGSFFSPEFASERVPTLAEALAVCKGGCRVDIELKDYGHDQHLEERVVEIVESAGIGQDIVTMSLSRSMVATMKRLRPDWTSGLLVAKAIGDLSRLPVDFLAVESRMATRSFIRRAHAAGKPVYVWTVDDPQRMVRIIGLGADGLITDKPALAKEVVGKYAAMSRAERLFLFVAASLGAEEEVSEPANNLRP